MNGTKPGKPSRRELRRELQRLTDGDTYTFHQRHRPYLTTTHVDLPTRLLGQRTACKIDGTSRAESVQAPHGDARHVLAHSSNQQVHLRRLLFVLRWYAAHESLQKSYVTSVIRLTSSMIPQAHDDCCRFRLLCAEVAPGYLHREQD